MKRTIAKLCLLTAFLTWTSQTIYAQKLSPVGFGWSRNSVNTTVFRNNSLTTHGDTQYIAYYDAEGFLTLGKRPVGTDNWTVERTQYKGNCQDAHNVISIAYKTSLSPALLLITTAAPNRNRPSRIPI